MQTYKGVQSPHLNILYTATHTSKPSTSTSTTKCPKQSSTEPPTPSPSPPQTHLFPFQTPVAASQAYKPPASAA